MKMWSIFASILSFLCVLEVIESKPIKKDYNYGLCVKDQFRCRNENCIKKSWFCDGHNHCGDNSDEIYCKAYISGSCPTHYPFFMCHNRLRCIPKIWQCDGVYDCQDRSDELKCLNDVEKISGAINANSKAISWMRGQRKEVLGQAKWGRNVFRISVALYLNNATFFAPKNTTGEELSYEVESRLLARLLRAQHDPLLGSELALAIHALLVTCHNPREFHGIDFVSDLREMVNEQVNYTSPFVLLALCNAGEKMTQMDIDKLLKITKDPLQPFWTDTQALALMALSCIAQKSGQPVVPKKSFDFASELRMLQSNNGSIENVKTTALVMQALLASREENDDEWDMEKAVKYLLKNQKSDGSFGNFMNTYYIIPLFQYKSLLNISSDHCVNRTVVDEDALEDYMKNKVGKKVRVTFSLWYGDKADVARLLELRVVDNSSLFDTMRYAAVIDTRYQFEYSILKSRPYVYSLSGVQNDPEKDKYWFLHKSTGNRTVLPEFLDKSPSEVKVHDKEHYVMWYRTGHWNQELADEVRYAVEALLDHDNDNEMFNKIQ